MIIEENVFFQARDVSLEGILTYNTTASAAVAGIIICSAHPQLGGDMNNNIVGAIHEYAVRHNCVTLRFNYRGAEKSKYPGAEKTEIDNLKSFWENSWSPVDNLRIHDVSGAVDFLSTLSSIKKNHLFVVGYSFGAYVAQQAAARDPRIKALALIAPTIHCHDFTPLNHITIPKMIISSDNDFAYPLEDLQKAYNNFSSPKTLKIFKGADHFFIGQEQELSLSIIDFMLNLHCKRHNSG